MEYGHGTGHGIGAYLNVHEGPAQSHGVHSIGSWGAFTGVMKQLGNPELNMAMGQYL